jgi:polyisoprenoid-binding protein YceI
MSKGIECRAGGLIVLLVLGLPVTGVCQAPRPAASAAVFQVDPGTSRVYIKVAPSGRMGHEHGVQGQLASGTITVGEGGSLVFAMNSFVTDTPQARQAIGLAGKVSASDQQKSTANMLGKDVLDVARYATADYAITACAPLDGQAPGDPGRYRLEGKFTLHGVTRPLPLVAQIERTATLGAARMRCAFSIQQSDYGITPYSTLGGLIGVADRLDIWGDLTIKSTAH